MVNKVTLIGNLGRDPEIRHLESGAMVAKFSIATNENYKDKSGNWQSQTEWHDVVVWRSLAERAEQSLKKGAMVYLEGKLTHRKWEDKDGNPRKTTEVLGNYFRLLNRRELAEGNNAGMTGPMASPSTSEGNPSTPPAVQATTTSDLPAVEDDLPF
ncbi:MAG: single-stranded DNA-binding protein [Bacteroidota bacterium]